MHGHGPKHTWWMLAWCIALPLILLLIGGKTGWGSNWLLLGFVALCVGSHIAMMFGGCGGEYVHKKFSECSECGLHYEDEKRAEECETWCKAHQSCNLEITSHAVENNR